MSLKHFYKGNVLTYQLVQCKFLCTYSLQASVYQSFQENSGNRYRPNHEIGQSSRRTRGESNLQPASAYDEALAQQFQLLEDCSTDVLESTINHPEDGKP